MIELEANNKHESKNIWLRIIRIILIIAVSCVFIFFIVTWYQNYLGAFVLFISAITTLALAVQPTKKIQLSLSQDGLQLANQFIPTELLLYWVMVDMEDVVEFVIQTGGIFGQYNYFYINKNNPLLPDFSLEMSQRFAYKQTLASQDILHRILKSLRLK